LPPAPGLANRTLRQVFYVSIGGSRLRVHLSNAYGTSAVALNAVHLALSTSGHVIDAASDRALTFAGSPSVTIAAGATATSDALDFALPPHTKVALSIAFGATPADVTGHPGSRTTSYIAAGDAVAATSLEAPATTAHWYFATGIDVVADPASSALVTLGDSITDGRGSTTDGNDRWPDELSRRLRQNEPTAKIAVLNQGIGGNSVLAGGNGPTALMRFERDVLAQAGVRWVVVFHGVNDIGVATDQSVANQLIDAYQQLVADARSSGIRAYGVPILPFGGSSYDTPDHEAVRQTVNAWIRAAGHFDAVIDFEATVRDPSNPTRLLPAYDDGDHLHLNAAGYQAMAGSIDLGLFAP
jgi:lysophospholipase L1-like esterase